MKNLFTILLSFSDHLVGIGQYNEETALDALKSFIASSEALEGYDRELLVKSIIPLVHYKNDKGVWGFNFDPEQDFSGTNDNPVLGGTIIQTDPKAPVRE